MATLKFLSIIFSTNVMTLCLALMQSQLWLPWKMTVTLGRQEQWGWLGVARTKQSTIEAGAEQAGLLHSAHTPHFCLWERTSKEQQETWDISEKKWWHNRKEGNWPSHWCQKVDSRNHRTVGSIVAEPKSDDSRPGEAKLLKITHSQFPRITRYIKK